MKFERFSNLTYPYFIADIAANHDGSLERAKELVWLAKEAGADCAKFQHFKADKIVNDKEFRKIENLKTHQSDWKKSVSQIYDDYHFRREWTIEVQQECIKADIDFSSTPYDSEAIELIKDICPFIKIGSGDVSWIDHVESCLNTGLPIVIATGACTIDDVKRVMQLINKYDNQHCIMQCNTNYTVDPDKIKFVNLNVLQKYKELFPNAILGLSDHTVTPSSVYGSLPFGVRIIEKHFTDDNDRIGPDHKFAVNPTQWREMVTRSREIIDSLGDGLKKVEENEINAYVVQRRSCVSNKDLRKGHLITEDDIDFLRPCPEGSVQPYDWKKIIGKKINCDIEKNESFRWTNLS
tara:strand:+ start:3986 stop:5038 length:1053 start_codon:yes stop_codon:yes gene_type:complete